MPFGLGWSITEAVNLTFIEPGGGYLCDSWREPQAVLYHVANTCFIVSYLTPTNRNGVVFMHSLLILGFLLFSAWAWNSICAPDAFSWGFSIMLLNVLQLFHLIYRYRPVTFDPELEEAYTNLFMPFKVPRLLFKKMVSAEFAQIMSLHAGEAYAMQNLTRTDRLGLLLSGKVNVMSDHQFLHPILPCEFLDSPEFESSRANVEDKFRVSIVAATSCRYLFWQRTALEYLFVKEAYLGTVVSTLVARDITTKLYAMNSKIMTEKGSHLDIRLPALASSLGAARSTPRLLRRRPCHREHRAEEDAAVAAAVAAAAVAVAQEAAQEAEAQAQAQATQGSPLSSRGLSGSRERLVTEPSVTIKERQLGMAAGGGAPGGHVAHGGHGPPGRGLPNGHLNKETETVVMCEPKGRSADALDLMGPHDPLLGDPLLGDPLLGDPLRGVPGANGSSGVESWLETSSKYHSCEMVED